MLQLAQLSDTDIDEVNMSESAKLLNDAETVAVVAQPNSNSSVNTNKYGSDEDHASPGSKSSPARDVDLSNVCVKGDEEAKSTAFVVLLTLLSAIGGFLFGYDTGVVAGAMLQLKTYFHLQTVWIEAIVSITIGAAAISSLFGGYLNDAVGRKPVIISASAIFTAGAILLGAAQNKYMLLGGRFVVGVGIGFASMSVPMYIAESAPPHLRGRMVVLNNLFITGGQFIASLIDGAFSFNEENGWRYMLGLGGVPSLIQFIGFFFMPESPRWLLGKGKDSHAKYVLQRIRGVTDVTREMEDIKAAIVQDQIAQQSLGNRSALMQVLWTKHVRKAVIIGCMLQIFQQISGINTVMYYSATIIKMSGVKSNSTAIWLAALTAFVNFIFTLVGLYLVEKIGRRKLIFGSIVGSTLSLALLAVSFQLMAYQTPQVTFTETGNSSQAKLCDQFSICDPCIENPNCGFCYVGVKKDVLNGSCVAADRNKMDEPNPNEAGYGRCSSEHTSSGVNWAYDYCPTSIAWLATVGLMLYLAFFSPGMGPMPWTINSEIYPLWARSTGNSLATFCNWTFNLLISMTFLTLTEVLTKYGAFWLYTCFSFCGILFIFFFVPETRGLNLEQVEDVFRKPWCSLRKPLT